MFATYPMSVAGIVTPPAVASPSQASGCCQAATSAFSRAGITARQSSAVIPARLEALVAAWQRPESWQGETTVGGVTMPATDIGYVANNELVLHGWDLSAATDQPFEVAEPNLDASWVMVFNTPDDPAARDGLFGPRLPVAESAPLLDRVLAGAGRDPYWSPEG